MRGFDNGGLRGGAGGQPPKRREKLVAGYELRVASYELRFEKLGDFGG